MDILEQTEIKLEWADLQKLHYHPQPVYSRSKGLHLSDILRKIAIETQQLTDEDREDEMPIRIFLGLAWEEMCVRLYPEINWQPGELKRDGVYGTPDGESKIGIPGLDKKERCVEEWKFTHKSCRMKGGPPESNRDIRGDWMWMHQIMGYCNLNQFRSTLARLHVCYANGNYTYPLTEKYIRYLIRFSDRELEGNWKMVMKYKRRML
jgi:hypothetical protein